MQSIQRCTLFTLITTVALLWCSVAELHAASRYVYGGDGTIDIASGSGRFKGAYRTGEDTYDSKAIAQIERVFGAGSPSPRLPQSSLPTGRQGGGEKAAPPTAGNYLIEIRFIEFLDYLQDHFSGSTITIRSGYRSPTYNQSLRAAGKLAGKASMHQYGMAADFSMKGVASPKIWEYVRDLGYGGAGFYHGALVHMDVGPSRFWDETSSKIDTDIADDNKLITLVPHRDIYRPGEELVQRFIRMSAYPIGVDPSFTLERVECTPLSPSRERDRERGASPSPRKGTLPPRGFTPCPLPSREGESATWKRVENFSPQFAAGSGGKCPQFSSIDDMKNIRTSLPTTLAPGRYRVRARFCEKEWEAMPEEIVSYEFEVKP